MNNNEDEEIFNYETFVEFLMSSDNENSIKSKIQTLMYNADSDGNPETFTFELYINICMELFFKIMEMEEHKNIFEMSEEDISNVFGYVNVYFNKFGIRIVLEETDDITERYCKIVFRQEHKYIMYFENNDADSGYQNLKDYLMLLSGDFQAKKYNKAINKIENKKMKEIHATCEINGKIFKLAFE